MVEDQYGIRLDSQVCATNPTVQKITDVFLNEMTEFGLTGVALDVVDIYPNSSSSGIKGFQNTCYCNHCLKELDLAGWTERQRPFIGAGNVSRFVLHLTDTGADHIEARHQWIRDCDASALVQLSEARAFVTEEDNSVEDAVKLLRYLAARAHVTATSIRRLGQSMRDKNLKVSVILGDEYFDMTQCTDIASLIKAEAADEYWLPSINSEFAQTTGVNAVQYFFGKATYTLNNLFEQIGEADGTIAAVGVEVFIERLLRVCRTFQNNKLNPGAVFAVELSDEYSGFVGVPITRNDGIQYIEGLTKGTLGQIVPRPVIDQIIAQVKLTSPEKSV